MSRMTDSKETPREEQVRKACEKAMRTGEIKDLAKYQKMQREDNELKAVHKSTG